MLKVTVSGSFHRHMGVIAAAVDELAELGVRVLSPADPRIVAHQGEFLFVASDPVGSVRLVQDRHLDCIRAADFLWLVCPDGYVGQSASMEIGSAATVGTPIFAVRPPSDLTLREYVKVVPTLGAAVNIVNSQPQRKTFEGILVNPHASIREAHEILERSEEALTRSSTLGNPAEQVYRDLTKLRTRLTLPTYMQ